MHFKFEFHGIASGVEENVERRKTRVPENKASKPHSISTALISILVGNRRFLLTVVELVAHSTSIKTTEIVASVESFL